jgi:hypothetical protein
MSAVPSPCPRVGCENRRENRERAGTDDEQRGCYKRWPLRRPPFRRRFRFVRYRSQLFARPWPKNFRILFKRNDLQPSWPIECSAFPQAKLACHAVRCMRRIGDGSCTMIVMDSVWPNIDIALALPLAFIGVPVVLAAFFLCLEALGRAIRGSSVNRISRVELSRETPRHRNGRRNQIKEIVPRGQRALARRRLRRLSTKPRSRQQAVWLRK